MADHDWSDHLATPGCYAMMVTVGVGDVCCLCYHHVIAYSTVTVTVPVRRDLLVCQGCGNALHARRLFTPGVVQRLAAVLLRRLELDMHALRMKRETEAYIDNFSLGDEGDQPVVH